MYKNILIATDGSELAGKGVEHGVKLAKHLGAKITLVSVTELLPSYGIVVAADWAASPAAFEDYREAVSDAARAILKQAKALADENGVKAEAVHMENQSPALGIVDVAIKHGCDLIVIASHGRRGISKLLLGSQAAEVLSLSEVPVLIIK